MSEKKLQFCHKCNRSWDGISFESCPFCGNTNTIKEQLFGKLGFKGAFGLLIILGILFILFIKFFAR